MLAFGVINGFELNELLWRIGERTSKPPFLGQANYHFIACNAKTTRAPLEK